MLDAVEENESAYAYLYDAATRSNAIVNTSIIWMNCVESSNAPPSTTTSIGSFTRDPIGFRGSEWGLYEAMDGKPLIGLDPSGLKCCLLTWESGTLFGSHSALKCDSGYYSKYPRTTHTEAEDNTANATSICMDCLDEIAIAAKWALIKNDPYDYHGANCATFIGRLLEAGMIPSNKSSCPQTCVCEEADLGCTKNDCAGSLRGGIPGPDTPMNLKSYFKCIDGRGCDPWSRKCNPRLKVL